MSDDPVPPPDITLRPYRAAEDLLPLVEIWHQASAIAHHFLGAERLAEHRDLIESIWLPAAETHVALIGGERAGFISLLGDVVGGLFVAPSHQGRGVGRALLEHALEDRGALELDVYLDNPKARAFYAAMGFEELSRSPQDREGLPFATARLKKARALP